MPMRGDGGLTSRSTLFVSRRQLAAGSATTRIEDEGRSPILRGDIGSSR